ncbi:MAG: 5'-methylthioadenosine/S-adenosylhomocysteine nucleosidase [Clostridia bacterium]
MTNIGMIVAVEIQAVLNKYADCIEEIEISNYKVKKYSAEKYNLFILHCGAGEIAAAAGTQFLITQFSVDLIVNFGVVGGLTAEMSTAKTCIVESVVHYDFDTSSIDHCEVARYLSYPSIYIPTSATLLKLANEICPTLKNVICASGDKFISSQAKKQYLHEQFGADICEMEAAGIVLTCNKNNTPCLLIKSISDSITGGATEFEKEVDRSAEICLDITDKIINSL